VNREGHLDLVLVAPSEEQANEAWTRLCDYATDLGFTFIGSFGVDPDDDPTRRVPVDEGGE
jgi:hypothetical protein